MTDFNIIHIIDYSSEKEIRPPKSEQISKGKHRSDQIQRQHQLSLPSMGLNVLISPMNLVRKDYGLHNDLQSGKTNVLI